MGAGEGDMLGRLGQEHQERPGSFSRLRINVLGKRVFWEQVFGNPGCLLYCVCCGSLENSLQRQKLKKQALFFVCAQKDLNLPKGRLYNIFKGCEQEQGGVLY